MPQLLAIVGGSGAGKTWLAQELQRRMGKEVGRLSLDDFYRDRSHLTPKRRESVNFDHPRAIDWVWLENVLKTVRSGRSAQIPQYNFKTHSRKSKRALFIPKPFTVIDGLWLLHRPSLRKLFHWKIFVDCPARVRLQRRLRRDATERGRTPRAVRRQFRQTVAPMHRKFIAPQAQWADIILNHRSAKRRIAELIRALRKSRGML